MMISLSQWLLTPIVTEDHTDFYSVLTPTSTSSNDWGRADNTDEASLGKKLPLPLAPVRKNGLKPNTRAYCDKLVIMDVTQEPTVTSWLLWM